MLNYDKFCVTSNPDTPPETLAQFAEDIDWRIRMNVARHLSTPISVLQKLASSKNELVHHKANQNHTYLHYRAVQDGVCEAGQIVPVEWLKQMYEV